RCCLLAAIIAVFAAGTGMVGPGDRTAHAAAASSAFGTTPSGVQVISDVKHDTSPPLRTLRGVSQAGIAPHEQRRHPHVVPQLPRDVDSSTPGTGSASASAMPSTTANFQGFGNGFAGPSGT